jgi:hypothetical protein
MRALRRECLAYVWHGQRHRLPSVTDSNLAQYQAQRLALVLVWQVHQGNQAGPIIQNHRTLRRSFRPTAMTSSRGVG